jgi:hypothetical protein
MLVARLRLLRHACGKNDVQRNQQRKYNSSINSEHNAMATSRASSLDCIVVLCHNGFFYTKLHSDTYGNCTGVA